MPYNELSSLHDGLSHTERDRKELLQFYKRFQQLRETHFEEGFKQFLKLDENEIRANYTVLDLMNQYNKNMQKLKENVNAWKLIVPSNFNEKANPAKTGLEISKIETTLLEYENIHVKDEDLLI